jgi:hypothetical protein
MKKSTLLLVSLALSTVAWSSANAAGGTCASPVTISTGGSLSGDTTTADTTVATVCGGVNLTGPVDVYTWTNTGGTMSGSITVTPSNATFDVGLALGDGATCAASLGTCDGTADSNGAGGAESITLTGLTTNKTYFLFVSSFASGGATTTSGPYTGLAGVLPVKLQTFEIN